MSIPQEQIVPGYYWVRERDEDLTICKVHVPEYLDAMYCAYFGNENEHSLEDNIQKYGVVFLRKIEEFADADS